MNQPGLIGCWIPEKHGGGTLMDLSGQNNHGTLNGPTWTSENGIWVLSFDGTDDFVDCGTDSSLDITGEIVVELWYYENARVFAGKLVTSSIDASHRWFFGSDNGKPYAFVQDVDNTMTDKTFIIPLKEWHHLVWHYSDNNNFQKIYLDGALKETKATPQNIATGLTEFVIGRHSPTEQYWLNGFLSNIHVYNCALSNAEIRHNYELIRHLYNV